MGPDLCPEGCSSGATNELVIRGEWWEGVNGLQKSGAEEILRTCWPTWKLTVCWDILGHTPRRANNWAVSRHLCLLLVSSPAFELMPGSLSWGSWRIRGDHNKIKTQQHPFTHYLASAGPWGQSVHPSLQTTRLRLKNLMPHSQQVSGLGLEPTLDFQSPFFLGPALTTQMEDDNECCYFVSPKAPQSV